MLTEEARNFNWLLETFVEETAGVTDAMAVSSDGVLIARSETLEGQESDLLCAIIAGTAGMAMAASSNLAAGALERVIITMERGFLFVSAIADGSCLAWSLPASATWARSATRPRIWSTGSASC
jgi:predicted regulator of Ras-like GTPase activity (Roadblock/LC7/MglB family)